MGKYTLMKSIVMHDWCPVYKHEVNNLYLYTNRDGLWCVSDTAGYDSCTLIQDSDHKHPSPVKTVPWEYMSDDGDWREDVTLKVFPCY